MKLIISLVLLFLLFTCSEKEKNNPPNIVVIFTDDQTYGAIGYNNPEIKTPVLDKLAAEGIIFQNNYTPTPICAASRASMMTGLFPQQNGTVALDSDSFIKNVCEDPGYPTIARIFNKAGYNTWFSGKSHLGPPEGYGFQKGVITQGPKDSVAFKNAIDLIHAHQPGDNPFFLWMAPRQPHVPLIPDEKWLKLYDATQISIGENFRESPRMLSMFNQGLPGEFFFRDSDYTHNWKNLPQDHPGQRQSSKISPKPTTLPSPTWITRWEYLWMHLKREG